MTTSSLSIIELLPTPSAKQVSISLASTALGDGCLMWRGSKHQLHLQGPSACKVTSFSCAKRRAISSRSCFLTHSWLCWPRLPFTTCSQLWIHFAVLHGPKSWTSKQYDNIDNIDSKVWPIWSYWNTLRISWVASSTHSFISCLSAWHQWHFNRCSFVYECVDSSPGLCCLLLSHIDSHPHLDALRFVRKLFPAQAAETRCEASDKNLISRQAWSLWIFMQHTYSQIM